MRNKQLDDIAALESEMSKLEAELGLTLEPGEVARQMWRLTAIKDEIKQLRNCCEPPSPRPDYEEPDSGLL